MLKIFFWLRYLHKKKIAFLSIAAVALSAALLITIAGIFGGFINAVEQTASKIFGDIYLDPYVNIPNPEKFLTKLEANPKIDAAAAIIETYGLLHIGQGNVRTVRVLGIDPEKFDRVTELKTSLLEQKNSNTPPSLNQADDSEIPSGFVSIGLLQKPDEKTDRYDFQRARQSLGSNAVLTIGSVVERKSATAGEKTQKQIKHKNLRFKITDIAFTGIYFKDSQDIYLPIDKVQTLTSTGPDVANQPRRIIQIKLTSGAKPSDMLDEVRSCWQQFAIEQNLPERYITSPFLKTSREMAMNFIAELQKQMAVLMFIFGVICSVAVLLIFCIFYMIVMTKQKDIAIIKTCGTGGSSIALIFLGYGMCVGIAGSAVGTFLGYIVIRNINIVEYWISLLLGLKIWKSSTYMFDRIPCQLEPVSTVFIILAAILAAVIGALIPAIVASKTKPVNILRYE